MNDYGSFTAIEQTVYEDGVLNQQVEVVTAIKPDMKLPYVLVEFQRSEVDLLCSMKSALINCNIKVFSDYAGDYELQALVARLDWLLQARVHIIRHEGINGRAVFKRVDVTKNYDTREKIHQAVLSYQIKILMES